jgi:PPOX class probable F420-dependent enzyme
MHTRIQHSRLAPRRHSQYLPMTKEEARSFVNEQYKMTLCTIDSNGFPHATPVWYVVIGDRIYFRAQGYKKKVRNILKHQQVVCVFDEGTKYTELRGVMIRGIAKIVDNDKTKRKEVFALLEVKYQNLRDTSLMPKSWQEKYGREHRVVIEVTPTSIVSWDNRKWLKQPERDPTGKRNNS